MVAGKAIDYLETAKQIEMLLLRGGDIKNAEIAYRLGISDRSVARIRKIYGLSKRNELPMDMAEPPAPPLDEKPEIENSEAVDATVENQMKASELYIEDLRRHHPEREIKGQSQRVATTEYIAYKPRASVQRQSLVSSPAGWDV